MVVGSVRARRDFFKEKGRDSVRMTAGGDTVHKFL